VTAGLGVPSTLTWKGSSTAPEMPAGVATAEMAKAGREGYGLGPPNGEHTTVTGTGPSGYLLTGKFAQVKRCWRCPAGRGRMASNAGCSASGSLTIGRGVPVPQARAECRHARSIPGPWS
jgi:hypothetical protein